MHRAHAGGHLDVLGPVPEAVPTRVVDAIAALAVVLTDDDGEPAIPRKFGSSGRHDHGHHSLHVRMRRGVILSFGFQDE